MISILLVLVVIEVATVTAVIMSQRVRTEEALELHAQQLLQDVANGTRENALTFLNQAQNVVQLTKKLLSSGLLSLQRPEELEQYFLDQLALVPQMDGLYLADPNGQFLFTKRGTGDSGTHYETKIIDLPGGVRRVQKIWRDENHQQIERGILDGDTYDPRARPWYIKANSNTELIWSDPYVFFTSRVPGITAASRVTDSSGKFSGITGVDVELVAISDFLAAEPVTSHGGSAALVHQNGNVLAFPSPSRLQKFENDQFRLIRLNELNPVFSVSARALRDKYPDLGKLKHSYFDSFMVDDKQVVVMFVPFSEDPQWPWLMGVYAPEELFSGTIRAGQQRALVLAIVVSIVIILGAFMLSPALIRPLTNLQEQAMLDPLSRLMNRRSFEEHATRPFEKAKQGDSDLSVMMIDIDHFKSVNDNFGHQVGDEVIVAVAGRIQQTLSVNDLVARYGG